MTTSLDTVSLSALSRQATTKLAASRLTSHSHGAGRVSSRSLIEKMTRRSGVAKPPKFDKWASPQHWTREPRHWRGGQVRGHGERCTSIKGEGRGCHPSMAKRK